MFRPHLTISRPGRRVPPELIDADVSRLASYAGPSWPVDAVSLFASEIVHTETGPSPRYTRLATVPMVV
jgi:2'-5' RNA ligase